MSEGTVHLRASLLLATGFSIGALYSQDARLLECAVGALAGVFLTPDLDVDSTYIGERIIQKKLGLLPRRLWNGFWKPYKRSLKHGGMFSHFPVISTLLRLFYIFWWLIAIPHTLIYFSFKPGWNLIYVLEWYAKILLSLMWFYGLTSSDFIHWALDTLTTKKEKT